MITDRSELSSVGKIAYSRYRGGGITAEQITTLVELGKLTADEQTFITGVQ